MLLKIVKLKSIAIVSVLHNYPASSFNFYLLPKSGRQEGTL